MTQTLSGAAIQIGAGSLGAGPIGLLFGQMVSGGAGAFGLGRDAFRNSRAALGAVSLTSMREALGRYSRLPMYSTPDALANSLGAQAPVIIIAALTIGPEAGYLALATRVMAAPMALVGGSIAQVYLAHAPEELRANRLGQFTTRILGGLFKTGVGPLIFVGIVAAPAFSIAFGPDWRRAGELVGWMTPWFVLQFISSPVSMVVHVVGRQRTMLMLTIAGLCIRVGAVLAAARIGREFLPEAYAIASAVFYALCTVVVYRLAGVKLRACLGAAKGSVRILAAWGLTGIIVLGVLDSWLRL